jgi:hypothetical protein
LGALTSSLCRATEKNFLRHDPQRAGDLVVPSDRAPPSTGSQLSPRRGAIRRSGRWHSGRQAGAKILSLCFFRRWPAVCGKKGGVASQRLRGGSEANQGSDVDPMIACGNPARLEGHEAHCRNAGEEKPRESGRRRWCCKEYIHHISSHFPYSKTRRDSVGWRVPLY